MRGHMYKDCRLPIISCGNLIFRTDKEKPQILMIQRKDSLCYIELLRGRFDINNINYIQTLFDKCSLNEKERLLNCNYKILWYILFGTTFKITQARNPAAPGTRRSWRSQSPEQRPCSWATR